MKIIRHDNVTYRFTNFDKDLTIDGEVYNATYQFSPTAYSSALGLQIENMEVTGAIDNIDISDLDIFKHLFYGAEVWIFSVDYKDIAAGKDKILYGTIGEVEFSDKEFRFEIRGISKRYMNLYSSYYGKICRARLGDSFCKVNLSNYEVSGKVYDNTAYNTVNTKYIRLDFTLNSSTTGILYYVKLINLLDNNILNTDTGVVSTEITTCSGSDGVINNLIDSNDSNYICLKQSSGSLMKPVIITLNYIDNFYKIILKDNYPTNYYLSSAVIYTSENGITWTSIANISISSYRSGSIITIPIGSMITPTATQRYKFRSLDVANALDLNGSPVPLNYFQYGRVEWTTGQNQGIQTEVIYSGKDGFVELALPTPYDIEPNDTFNIYPGCNHLLFGSDGKLATGHCKSRYNNVINFRGEPYLPNEDVLLSGYIAVKANREEAEGDEIYLEPV
jgi:hypothetical protein